MQNTETTINSVMELLDDEFISNPPVHAIWSAEKSDILYCVFKEKPGYFYNITENISALEEDESNSVAMFAEAASVLFDSTKEDNNVQMGDVMIALAKILALYIYGVPLCRRHAVCYTPVTSVNDIPTKVLCKEAIEEAAIFIYATSDGIHGFTTASTFRVVLGLILILLWEKHMDALKEIQRELHHKISAAVSGILGSKQ